MNRCKKKHITANYLFTCISSYVQSVEVSTNQTVSADATVTSPDTKINICDLNLFSVVLAMLWKGREGANELIQALADPIPNQDYSSMINRQLRRQWTWICISVDRLLNTECITSTILRNAESVPTLVRTQDDDATCEQSLICI
mgnify:CR=1 FL=1